jgi:hypothetical protein
MSKTRISIVLKHRCLSELAGCEGLDDYFIFSDGQIFSLKRNIYLSHILNHDGYVRVFINKGNKPVHRLLALAFIPNPLNKSDVDHIDRDKSNNTVGNLRWATKSENNHNRSIDSNNKSGYDCIFKTYEKKEGIVYHFWQVMVRCKGKPTLTRKKACKASDTVVPEELVECRDEFKRLLHGTFANII